MCFPASYTFPPHPPQTKRGTPKCLRRGEGGNTKENAHELPNTVSQCRPSRLSSFVFKVQVRLSPCVHGSLMVKHQNKSRPDHQAVTRTDARCSTKPRNKTRHVRQAPHRRQDDFLHAPHTFAQSLVVLLNGGCGPRKSRVAPSQRNTQKIYECLLSRLQCAPIRRMEAGRDFGSCRPCADQRRHDLAAEPRAAKPRLSMRTRQLARSPSSASGRADRALALMAGWATASILKLQRIEPLLVVLGCRIDFINARQRAPLGTGWYLADAVAQRRPSLIGLFAECCPFALSQRLPFSRTVLLLRVVVRTVVEKLWVDFHEELHGIVHHAVNGSTRVVSNVCHRQFRGR